MAFEEYQFLRYFIPGTLFVIYTMLLMFPVLRTEILDVLMSEHPEIIIGIIVGAFAGSLAFGYLIYTFYDTILYNTVVMNPMNRILLIYLSTKIPNWEKLENHEKKSIMEMMLTFYEIGKGWWSDFNVRIVCALFVPGLSVLTCLLFWVGDQLLSTVEVFSVGGQYMILYILIVPAIVAVSLCLGLGARKSLKEATYYEYYFIKNKIEGNEEYKENENKFQKMISILQNEEWKKLSKDKQQ